MPFLTFFQALMIFHTNVKFLFFIVYANTKYMTYDLVLINNLYEIHITTFNKEYSEKLSEYISK